MASDHRGASAVGVLIFISGAGIFLVTGLDERFGWSPGFALAIHAAALVVTILAFDNVFVERLWRTVKYEHVYLYDYATVIELEKGLDQYFTFYNYERPHQSLSYQTPAEVHLEPILARN